MDYEAEVDKLIGVQQPISKPATVDYDKQVDQLIASKKKAPMTDAEWQAEKESSQDNALQRGWHSMASSVDATTSLATKDYERIADIQVENANYRAMNPGNKSANELTDAFRAEGNNDQSAAGGFENFKAGVGRMADVAANNYNKAQGFIPKARSVLDTAGGVVSVLGEQVPNMVPSLVGMGVGSVGGAAAGAPIGTAIGSAGGPVGAAAGGATGAAVGSFVGGAAGAGIGNALVEGGSMIEQDLQKAGIAPGDKAATVAYLNEHGDKTLGQAGIKGAVLGTVDRATMGMAHSLLTAPGRAAERRALTSLGVDTADNAAVAAARATQREAIGRLVASDAVYQASKSGVGAVARNTAAFGLEPLGEFTGEYVGEGLGRGNWDTKEAAFEALMSLGQSGLIFAGQKVAQAVKAPFEQQGTPPAPPSTDPLAPTGLPGVDPALANEASPPALNVDGTPVSTAQDAATQEQPANQLTPEALQALSRISDEQMQGVREQVAAMPDSEQKTTIQAALDATVAQRAELGYTPHVDTDGYTYGMDTRAVESLQEQARTESTADIEARLISLVDQGGASDTTRVYERELNRRYEESQQAPQDAAVESAAAQLPVTPTLSGALNAGINAQNAAAPVNADAPATLTSAALLHSSAQQAPQPTLEQSVTADAAQPIVPATTWASLNPLQRNGLLQRLGIETRGNEGAQLRNVRDIAMLPQHVQQVIEASQNPIPAEAFQPTHTDRLGGKLMAYPGLDGVYQDERGNVSRSDAVPPTPIQQANVVAPIAPQSSSKSFTPNPRSWGEQETNNLAQIVRAAGGMHKEHATTITGDEAKNAKSKAFFTNNGMGIDDAIRLAKEHGFIINLRKGEDETAAYTELFAQAANGERVTNDPTADLEKQYQSRLDEDEARAREADELADQESLENNLALIMQATSLSDNELAQIASSQGDAFNQLLEATNEYQAGTTDAQESNRGRADTSEEVRAEKGDGDSARSSAESASAPQQEEADLLGDNVDDVAREQALLNAQNEKNAARNGDGRTEPLTLTGSDSLADEGVAVGQAGIFEAKAQDDVVEPTPASKPVVEPEKAVEATQEPSYAPELMDKITSAYGYPEGVDTMPEGLGKTAKKLYAALINGDADMLKQLLHPDNKITRNAYEAISGQKLPKTVRDTNTFAEGVAGSIKASQEGGKPATKPSNNIEITADTFAQLGKRASKSKTDLRDKLAGTDALNVHDNFNTIVTALEKSGFVTKDC